MLLRRGAVDQATVVRMSKKTKKLAVERRDGSFLDRVQVPPVVPIPFHSVIATPLCILCPNLVTGECGCLPCRPIRHSERHMRTSTRSSELQMTTALLSHISTSHRSTDTAGQLKS